MLNEAIDHSASGRHPRNLLLRSLPEADFERLRPDLESVPTALRQVLYTDGDRIHHVYFPNHGVASITKALSDGTMVETLTVGMEGMVGLELFFARDARASGDAMIQVAGDGTSAERLPAAAFRRELERHGPFAELIGRYGQAAMSLMMQSAACNARHHIQQRCSRWLLMTHDRVGEDRFQLSHEFLAVMLGVRRQSVTGVAGTLQAPGLIAYRHGWMTVKDRPGLEAASCECYGLVRSRFEAML